MSRNKRIDELNDEVRKLATKYGHVKINLIHTDGSSEGVWAAVEDERGKLLVQDDGSDGDLLTVRLCNAPLGWRKNVGWGARVQVKTQGSFRPVAKYDEQPPPVDRFNKKLMQELIAGEQKQSRQPKKGAK